MTEAIRQRIETLKVRLVGSCNRCDGSGYVERDGTLTYCSCMYVFEFLMELTISRIPKTYWTLGLRDLESVASEYKKFVKYFLSKFDRAVENSLGVLFLGPNGVGKTSLQSIIGKEAIGLGYSVRYVTLEQYLSELRRMDESSDLLKGLEQADVILLDELDKAYVKRGSDFSLKKTEDFIRNSISSGKSLVVCTNLDEGGISDVFGESALSMMSRSLKFVEIDGDDYSSQLQSEWGQLIEDSIDYYHPEITRLTTMFHENRGEV